MARKQRPVRPCEHFADGEREGQQCGEPATHEHTCFNQEEVLAICPKHAKDCKTCVPMAKPAHVQALRDAKGRPYRHANGRPVTTPVPKRSTTR